MEGSVQTVSQQDQLSSVDRQMTKAAHRMTVESGWGGDCSEGTEVGSS